MRFGTGWFPYVLAALWAAMLVASLVDMAKFDGAMRAAKAGTSVVAPIRTPQAKAPRAM
jgi:hypothetical protein